MKDTFNREIKYLRLSVTDLCNLRCRYCMPEDGVCKMEHGDVCTVEELIEIVRQSVACGIHKVRLTGGEPLVRNGIVDICRGVARIPGVEELCITTNGVNLERLAPMLKDAGVTRLNVSLDTLRPDRYAYLTRIGHLEDVLRGLKAAIDAGFTKTKLNTVLLGGFNEDEIPDFVELTRDRDLEIRFIELMPIGEGVRGTYLPSAAVLEACPELTYDGSSGVAKLYRLPDGVGRVGLIQPMSNRFCAQCDRIRVTADGKLKPCLHSDEEFPLRGLRGEELRRAIETGIHAKPQRHYMVEEGYSESHRRMNQIGG